MEMFLQIAITTRVIPLSKEDENDLFSKAGPLATLSAMIDMGYALGLISKEVRDELHLIREIRNAFAHTIGVIDFAMPEVANVCKRLWTPV